MLKKLFNYTEIAGLILILIASGWQLVLMQWWDNQISEWEIYIDRQADTAILFSIVQLANMIRAESESDKKMLYDNLASHVHDRGNSINDQSVERRKEIRSGHYSLFGNIYKWMFLIGSFMALCGKFMARRVPSKTEESVLTLRGKYALRRLRTINKSRPHRS
jgi:hypothetical protein